MLSWNSTELQDCLCWSLQDNEWCYSGDDVCRDYYESRYYLAVPAALGIAFLVLLLAMYIVLRVCGTMWCCAKTLVTCRCAACPAQGAGTGTVRMYRGVWIAVCGALLVQCLYGMSQFGDFNDSATTTGRVFGKFGDNMHNVDKQWTNQARSLRSALTEDVYTYRAEQVQYDIESAHHDMDTAADALHNIHTSMRWSTDAVSGAMWVSMALVALTGALMLCNLHYVVPSVSLLILWCVGCIVFAIQVSLAAVETVASDGCRDFAGVANFTHNVTASQLGNTSSMMASAAATAADLDQLYLDTNCPGVERMFGEGPLLRVCNVTFTCSACTSTVFEMQQVLNTSRIITDVVNASDWAACGSECSITQCATQCREGSVVRAAAAAAVAQLAMTQESLVQLNATLTPLRSGSMFADFTASLQQGMCVADNGLASATSPLASLTAAAGFTLCVAAVLAALGNYIYHGKAARDEVEPITPQQSVQYYTFVQNAEEDNLPVKPVQGTVCDPELGVPVPQKDVFPEAKEL